MVQNNAASLVRGPSKLLGNAAPLVLRIEGTERDGQIIRIHSPKCLVGSAAQCELRLIAADVQPQHCVIYRGKSGMAVRSWTRDTRVNGNTVSEAWLRVGDRLSLGSLNFEILSDQIFPPKPAHLPAEEKNQLRRRQRRQSHRRIRNLLDVLRQQKDSFGTLQGRLEETQQLVNSLLSREVEPPGLTEEQQQEHLAEQAATRRTGHRRARALLVQVRALLARNEQLQTNLAGQLEAKQVEIDRVLAQVASSAEANETLQQQQTHLVSQLEDAQAMIAHLREQATELQAREAQIDAQLQQTRRHSRGRVKSLLTHLRAMRDQLTVWEQNAQGNGASQERLTALEAAHAETICELQQHREALKEAESDLAWSQEELRQRSQQLEELRGQTEQLEHQLAAACAEREAASAAAQNAAVEGHETDLRLANYETHLEQLRHQLQQAQRHQQSLQEEADLLRQQNRSLQIDVQNLREAELQLQQQLSVAEQDTHSLRAQLEAQREPEPHAPPATASPNSDSPEGEPSPLQRLHGTGVLKENAVDTEQSAPDQENPPQASPEATGTGLSSFPSYPPEEEPAAPVGQPGSQPFEPSPVATGDDEDDASIDAYMQSLLERMRAKSGETTVASSYPGSSTQRAPSSSTPLATPEPKPVEEPDVVQPLISTEEFRPSRFAPEQTSDIRKLRELANETAKAAIDSATLNRWETLCKSKLAVSLCALVAGFVLHYLSKDYLSMTFAGACLAYVVTVFWWLQAAVIYNHVKTHRRERMEQRIQEEILGNREGTSRAG